MENGTIVTLTPGTRVGLDTDERFDWGGIKKDWFVVGEGDGDLLTGNEFRITGRMGPHSTMNGGGYDYFMECTQSLIRATVRTTFKRNESLTFNSV